MIGVFDSGFGGLTVLKSIVQELPEYDCLYLGDNARVPYGGRSERIVYKFTKQAVAFLFKQGCPLIIIACNTASAKALRRIQQEYLPKTYPERRVLGVVRPSVEEIAKRTLNNKVGLLATEMVVSSRAFTKEINKLNPSIEIFQQACPLLVPIVEAGEHDWEGTDMIIKRYLRELFDQNNDIDTLLLACTHYPILYPTFERHVPSNVTILEQGPLVAKSLKDYLLRHPEIEKRLTKSGTRVFLTTDISERFDRIAHVFYGEPILSKLASVEPICKLD
ncbi:MAG: glutamate racemase [Thermodesulfobacteriota bacterium]|nr:glutamate racemase [Thermodesulfobacteriota bacterium]